MAETIYGHGSGNVWMRMLDRYGLPAAIAAFLVWFLTHSVASDLTATKALVGAHVAETRWYLWAICMNVAGEDASQRARCYVPTQIPDGAPRQ